MFIRCISKIYISPNQNSVAYVKVFNYQEVAAEDAECCAAKTKIRWLITQETGAENFAMRLFEMAPEGYSPLHKHATEHEVFVLEGEGLVFDGEKEKPLQVGDVVFIPPNEMHQFKNNSATPLKFLCLIPCT